jgi:hypothetical protein
MGEQFDNGFVPAIPEFDSKPRGPQFHREIGALGGAAIPFGFSPEHSTPVVEKDFDVAETRTSLKWGAVAVLDYDCR